MPAPPGAEVQAMFGEIAPQYDFLNRVLSFGIDRSWRRKTVRTLGLTPQHHLLDLCCGTGDLGLEFASTGVELTGADFTMPMLPLAQQKAKQLRREASWVQADAQFLPFAPEAFDALSISFGIRNVENPQSSLAECWRVLKPGGQLAILEFFPIKNPLWRWIFRFYFHQVLPRIARLCKAGRTGAYEYLPESVDGFASVEDFSKWMQQAGFSNVRDLPLTGGVARLLVGRKPLETQ